MIRTCPSSGEVSLEDPASEDCVEARPFPVLIPLNTPPEPVA